MRTIFRFSRYIQSESFGNRYGVCDNLTGKWVEYYGLHDWIHGVDCIVNLLNDDETLYYKQIGEYAGDTVIHCPECNTLNYHFNNGFWCCAFC